MKTTNRLLFWYYALTKRLIKRPAFLIILALIPIFAFSLSGVSGEESGFVHVAMVQEDKTDSAASNIIKELKANNKIAKITVLDSDEEAKEMLLEGKVDTAWVFKSNLISRAAKIAAGEKETLVSIYLCEDNTFTRAAREKLLGSLFPLVSYELYKTSAEKIDFEFTDEELLAAYDAYKSDEGLIDYGFINSSQAVPKKSDFLTAPLRGLLCTVIMLCGLAAALYFNNDDREGTFSNLSPSVKGAVFLANNLAATLISGIFVSVALALAGDYAGFWRESLLMLLFVLATTGFCTLLGALLRTPQKMAVALPVTLILSVALSPVFFNVKRFKLFQSFLPLYHYLYGKNDSRFVLSLALWAVFYILAAYYIYTYKNKGYVKR